MTFLLDTNACIALIDGRPEKVRGRLARALAAADEVATSSIALFELWYGVAKSARRQVNSARLNAFLAGPIGRIEFDEQDAREAGEVRAQLETMGRRIGAYNLLIAGQARRRGTVLITANASEFDSVPNLNWEDWAS